MPQAAAADTSLAESPLSSSPFHLTPSSTKSPDKKSSLEELKNSSRVRGSIFKESQHNKKQAKNEHQIARTDSKASLRTSRRLRGPRSQEDEKEIQRKSVQFDAEPSVRTFIPPTPDPEMSPVHEPNFQNLSDSDDELPYISPENLRPLPQVPGRKLPTVPMTKLEVQTLGMKISKEEKAKHIMLHAQSKKAKEVFNASLENALGISMQDVGSLSIPSLQNTQYDEKTSENGSDYVMGNTTYQNPDQSRLNSSVKGGAKSWITREDVRRRARERREAQSAEEQTTRSDVKQDEKPSLSIDTKSTHAVNDEHNEFDALGSDIDDLQLDLASEEVSRLTLLPQIDPIAGSLSDGLGLQQYFMSASPEARSPSDWAQKQIHSGSRAVFPSSPTSIPQKFATVRAPGSKLKVRPSLSPADTQQMAETRRKVSGESAPSSSPKDSNSDVDSISDIEDEDLSTRIPEFRPLEVALEMPGSHDSMDDITSAFDRVIESQNKGYITRKHSQLVQITWGQHDAHKHTLKSPKEGLPQEKARLAPCQNVSSHLEEQEQNRLQSGKNPSSNPSQSSLDILDELSRSDEVAHSQEGVHLQNAANVSKISEDGDPRVSLAMDSECIATSGTASKPDRKFEERGRLFVKVVSAKNLGLPIPEAKVEDQPFDDVNSSSLNIRPKSTLSRIFTSPKKKAKEISNSLVNIFDGQVAPDGSFARAYVSLDSYEKLAYGRRHTAEVSCFNEWAIDLDPLGSKGKRLSKSMDRKPPYKIGKLEIHLFFVPIPLNAQEVDLPKSLHSCTQQMRDAEWHIRVLQEGFLSQQGGDCPYWRRRYFRMVGPKLTAYHEATRLPRACINLYNAVALIDDRDTLMSDYDADRKRSTSAFAEQEGGYMFVEEGFRLRFANGEVIDFYAATKDEKKAWIQVLESSVGKIPVVKPWTRLILEKETLGQVTEVQAA